MESNSKTEIRTQCPTHHILFSVPLLVLCTSIAQENTSINILHKAMENGYLELDVLLKSTGKMVLQGAKEQTEPRRIRV